MISYYYRNSDGTYMVSQCSQSHLAVIIVGKYLHGVIIRCVSYDLSLFPGISTKLGILRLFIERWQTLCKDNTTFCYYYYRIAQIFSLEKLKIAHLILMTIKMPLHIFIARFYATKMWSQILAFIFFSLTFQSLTCFPSLCLLKLLDFPPDHVPLGYCSLFVCQVLKLVFSIWLVLLPLHSAYRLELLPLRQRFIYSFIHSLNENFLNICQALFLVLWIQPWM